MKRLVLSFLALTFGQLHGDSLKEYDFQHGLSFLHGLKYGASVSRFDYVNPHAPKGGTLVRPATRSFSSLKPFPIYDSSTAPGINWIFDTLLVRSGDEISAFYGRLASGIAIAPNRRSIAFKLHADARWHDGVPITSRDVEFTITAYMDAMFPWEQRKIREARITRGGLSRKDLRSREWSLRR